MMAAEKNEVRCFPCVYPGRYDLESAKWLQREGKLCPEHIKKTEALAAAPPVIQKPFSLKPVKKNWQDREPGEDG
jgi:hypothetical protein